MAKKDKELIKCPLCSGDARLTSKEFALFNGDIILKDTPVYKCGKCKTEFNTSEQVRVAEQKLRKAFFFRRQIITTGGSLGITFPSDLMEYYGLNKGSHVSIVPENKNTIKIITQNK